MGKALTRDEIALQIFIKRMPSGPLNEEFRRGYVSAAAQSYEIADLFIVHTTKPPKVTTPLPDIHEYTTVTYSIDGVGGDCGSGGSGALPEDEL